MKKLNDMTVTELQAEMAAATGDYRAEVEEIMVQKELAELEGKKEEQQEISLMVWGNMHPQKFNKIVAFKKAIEKGAIKNTKKNYDKHTTKQLLEMIGA